MSGAPHDHPHLPELLATSALPSAAPLTSDAHKIITVIRHGESEYNKHYSLYCNDPMVFDAPLTPAGVKQAEGIRGKAAALDPELIVTSPLIRSVQTCLLAFPHEDFGDKVKYEVWSTHRESLEASCDLGSPLETLCKKFPQLSFCHLPPVWWYCSEDCDPASPEHCYMIFRTQGFIEPYDVFIERVDLFASQLRARPESRIVIFGHGDFFHTFLERHLQVPSKWMQNCEVITGKLAFSHHTVMKQRHK